MNRTFKIGGICVCWASLLTTPGSLAQESDAGKTSPRPSADDIQKLLEQEKPEPELIPAQPEGESTPDASHTDAGEGSLIWPEGWMHSLKKGKLIYDSGSPYFVFTEQADSADNPPIAILPNSKLKQMESYASSASVPYQLAVTGPVTVYQGRNYLLVRDVVISSKRQVAEEGQKEDTSTESKKQEHRSKDRSALVAAMDASSSADRMSPLPSQTPDENRVSSRRPVAPGLERARLIAEDTIIDNRLVRLVREGEWWTVAFEAQGDKPAEAPLRVLPSLSLQTMQELTFNGLRSILFTITGEVTEYDGHNYILIQRFTVTKDDGNLFQE